MTDQTPIATHLEVPIYINNGGKFWCRINPDQASPRWRTNDPNIVTRATLAAVKAEITKRKALPDPETGKGGPLAVLVIRLGYSGVTGFTTAHTLVANVHSNRGYGKDQWRTERGELLERGRNRITPAAPWIEARVKELNARGDALQQEWKDFIHSLPEVEATSQGRPYVPSEEAPDA